MLSQHPTLLDAAESLDGPAEASQTESQLLRSAQLLQVNNYGFGLPAMPNADERSKEYVFREEHVFRGFPKTDAEALCASPTQSRFSSLPSYCSNQLE